MLFIDETLTGLRADSLKTTKLKQQQTDDKRICLGQNCGPNGTCININNKLAHCLCKVPYYGDKCQYRDECYTNPCPRPNDICLQLPNNSFICQGYLSLPPLLSIKDSILTTTKTTAKSSTTTRFKSQNSIVKVTCTDDYCNRNGVCKVLKNASIVCSCLPHKTGPRCQFG